ncbi:MAG: YggS family pyridoxal phosphate-dependent enzyme [Flavobacteriales bacterium]|nr:YggS family pyridoxal phosphate-dependent enzyme [Flavobacteriales bacterium]
MIEENYLKVKQGIPSQVTLVAVSKTHPASSIQRLYDIGHRDFGENKVQELLEKQAVLPADIRWHLIGHLQTNKVKYIVPFIHLIHSVDSEKLLNEINKQAQKINRIIDILLQVHIAQEVTKYGFSEDEIQSLYQPSILEKYSHIRIRGLMGMATNTSNEQQIRKEFSGLKRLFDKLKCIPFAPHSMDILSMGMSNDYSIAIEEGSTLVRIGSNIFGERNY